MPYFPVNLPATGHGISDRDYFLNFNEIFYINVISDKDFQAHDNLSVACRHRDTKVFLLKYKSIQLLNNVFFFLLSHSYNGYWLTKDYIIILIFTFLNIYRLKQYMFVCLYNYNYIKLRCIN